MPRFAYQARDAASGRKEGVVEAADRSAAAALLRRQGLQPLRIRETGPEVAGWAATFWQRARPVPAARLAQFFTQLASLVRSGINAHEAMAELSVQTGDRRLARAAHEMAARLGRGEPLAENLERYPALFPPHVPAVVRAGEEFGGLAEVLLSLAEQFATDAEIEARLRWVRRYYGAVLVLAVFVAPFPLMIARGIGWYGWLALTTLLPAVLGLVVLAWLARGGLNLPALARVRSAMTLWLPVFGPVARWSALARLLDTLRLSQRAGVTLDRGLEMAGAATGHPRMRDAAEHAAREVRTGRPLGEALQVATLAPPRVRQMLATSERSGSLEAGISAAADWAAQERAAAVASVSGMAAGGALVLAAIITLIALAIAWRNYYEALFERYDV
ncbi:MAG: type II secretion system F family protein [Armatimonadota bacterium]